MAAHTVAQFEKNLAKAKQAPLFSLLISPDRLVLDRMQATLLKKLDPEDRGSIEIESIDLDGDAHKVSERLVTALQTVSMFSPTKLIVLKNFESADRQNEEILLKYIEQRLETSFLLLQCAKIRANHKIRKIADKDGWLISAVIERRPQFEAWLRESGEALGLDMYPALIQFLADNIPINLTRARNELEKLALYTNSTAGLDDGLNQENSDQPSKTARKTNRPRIELDVAAQLVCSTQLDNVFKLTDAIGEGKKAQALSLLNDMVRQGEAPQMLLAMIARHFRHLYRVKLVADLKMPRADVGQALETTSSFVIDKAVRQSRSFSLQGLRQAVHWLYVTDREMKSTPFAPAVLLEKLLFKLCALEQGGEGHVPSGRPRYSQGFGSQSKRGSFSGRPYSRG